MVNRRVLNGIAILALIVAVLVLISVLAGGNATSDREIPGISIPDYILTGGDNTIYLFSGDNISAIASDGSLIYNYVVPEGLGFCSRWLVESFGDYAFLSRSGHPTVCEDNGTLYLYLKPGNRGPASAVVNHDYNDTTTSVGRGTGMLVAIDRAGRSLWSMNVADMTMKFAYIQPSSDVSLYARGGLLYLFHDYNETVIGVNGTVLWSIGNVSDPGAVNDAGNLYVVNAVEPWAGEAIPRLGFEGPEIRWDYRVPGSVIDSYDSNGSLRWRQYSYDVASRQGLLDGLPLCHGGIIYVPSEKSVTAIGDNGSRLWLKTFDSGDYPNYAEVIREYGLSRVPPSPSKYVLTGMLADYGFVVYPLMPFDTQGNLYVEHPIAGTSGPSGVSFLLKISPDGREISRRMIQSINYTLASDSMLLDVAIPYYTSSESTRSIDDLSTGTLSAYDPGSGACLWNFTVPVDQRTTLTVTESNLASLIPADELDLVNSIINLSYYLNNTNLIPGVMGGVQSFDVYPGNGIVYIGFQTRNFEYPLIPGQSRYVYSGGVYALSDNGTLLWYVPTAPGASVLAASNSTIIYNTGDGKTYAKAVGAVAGGVAVISGFYLAFSFFAGTVTRARGRVNKNGNRMAVLDYIVANPGSTLYEIARGSGINRGTVRYHLFILGVNHHIIAHETGEKFVRYFTNSGSYTPAERSLLSLLRREPLRRTIRIMGEKPGISSQELAKDLGVSATAVNRHIALLVGNGIIEQVTANDRGQGYSIKGENREQVEKAMKIVKQDNS